MENASRRTIELDAPLDLRRTFAATGLKGLTQRVADGGLWRATRTPDGPAALRLTIANGHVEAAAWGAGREWVLERVHLMIGTPPEPLAAHHDAVADALRRGRAVRLPRVMRMVEVLIPVIIAQKVTGIGAARSYRDMVVHHSERAPGPVPLWLPPDPGRLAELPYYEFHPLGIEQKRADTLIRVSREARRLDALADKDVETARSGLAQVRGIGPWTIGRAMLVVSADPDAVPVGDYHIPNTVTWALAGEPRGTDERMLELLTPYAGQRGRVIRLLELFAGGAPKYGPRSTPREFRRH
jgi:3-methyladenine DNA glycosylase/8-oxoguanine DNA glycosylase